MDIISFGCGICDMGIKQGDGEDMNDKIKELLAVLDLSKSQQEEWIIDKFYNGVYPLGWTGTFADLAFRLRDEAVKDNRWIYSEKIHDVCQYVNKPKADNCSCFDAAMWLENEGQPVHFIVAAELTKQEGK